MNKILYSGIALLLLAGAVLIIIKISAPADERLAKDFIAALYSVPDHDRYQNLLNKMGSADKPDFPVTTENTVQQLSADLFQEYIDLYTPMMTPAGLDQLFSQVRYSYVEKFADEYGYLVKPQKITLRSVTTNKEYPQYQYTVGLKLTHEQDNAIAILTGSGQITLARDEDGVFRVDDLRVTDSAQFDPMRKKD